ncbi:MULTISPECIES: carbohydrate porin [Aphanothece]|uniref:carbohydrate porin n=1 Tax=Aphanothece TaxID=1121 RepID=UPI0039852903
MALKMGYETSSPRSEIAPVRRSSAGAVWMGMALLLTAVILQVGKAEAETSSSDPPRGEPLAGSAAQLGPQLLLASPRLSDGIAMDAPFDGLQEQVQTAESSLPSSWADDPSVPLAVPPAVALQHIDNSPSYPGLAEPYSLQTVYQADRNSDPKSPKLEVADSAPKADSELPSNPFGIVPLQEGEVRSRALHCDALEHLKTPRTYRRLDSYFRPDFLKPRGSEANLMERDYLTGNWGGARDQLYEQGIEFYGCIAVDLATDLVSNARPNNRVLVPKETAFGTPSSGVHRSEYNIVQIYGLDLYSRLINKNWKGGQLHFSATWPESEPLYAYRNRLNATGTGQIHGHFYTNQGVGDPTYVDQGVRLFELWFQQRYGPGQQSYVRFGNIFPMITFNRSILSGMMNFWTFTEPCMLGTTYFTGNAPCYPQAPLSFQWYHKLGPSMDFEMQVSQGYYASTGRNNIRGVRWNFDKGDGVEVMSELTWLGGTYSGNPKDYGKPWYVKAGVMFHSGKIYSNRFDINGDPAAITGLPRQELQGNQQVYLSTEAMLYREPNSYNRGLTGFFRVGGGFHDDRNVVKNWAVLGLGYEGLLRNRPHDVLYAGWGVVRGTDGFVDYHKEKATCTKIPGCDIDGIQHALEFGYSFYLSPWFTVTPTLQYIINPNLRSDLGNILTLGVATRISF